MVDKDDDTPELGATASEIAARMNNEELLGVVETAIRKATAENTRAARLALQVLSAKNAVADVAKSEVAVSSTWEGVLEQLALLHSDKRLMKALEIHGWKLTKVGKRRGK